LVILLYTKSWALTRPTATEGLSEGDAALEAKWLRHLYNEGYIRKYDDIKDILKARGFDEDGELKDEDVDWGT
jgi:hypothetical protein